MEIANEEKAGSLVPVAEIRGRFEAAAQEMRKGTEVLRRDVETRCCERCRPLVGEAITLGYDAVRRSVVEALDGKQAAG